MARRKKRRSFAGTAAAHRLDAGSIGKEARKFAQAARVQAKWGDCRSALHLFGVAAWHAGQAHANRKWIGKGRSYGHFGRRIHDLQKTIFRLCRIS